MFANCQGCCHLFSPTCSRWRCREAGHGSIGCEAAEGGSGCRHQRGQVPLFTGNRKSPRMRKTQLRKSKIRRLARVASAKAQVVYTCGICPGGSHGDEISGVSDVEWRKMQQLASTAYAPCTGGRSVSALWLARSSHGPTACRSDREVEQRSVVAEHASARRNGQTLSIRASSHTACSEPKSGSEARKTCRQSGDKFEAHLERPF